MDKQKTLMKKNMKYVSLTMVLIGFIALSVGYKNQDVIYQVGGVASLVFGTFVYYYISKFT